MNDDPNTDVIDLTKEKLSKIIADINKDNAPADGWKKEELKNIMEGN